MSAHCCGCGKKEKRNKVLPAVLSNFVRQTVRNMKFNTDHFFKTPTIFSHHFLQCAGSESVSVITSRMKSKTGALHEEGCVKRQRHSLTSPTEINTPVNIRKHVTFLECTTPTWTRNLSAHLSTL